MKDALEVLGALGIRKLTYSDPGFGVQFEADAPPGVAVPDDAKVLQQIGFRTPFDRFHHLPDDERRAQLLVYFGNLLASFPGASTAQAALMPLLRPAAVSWRTTLQLKLQYEGMEIVRPQDVSRPFCRGLRLHFVFDSPSAINFVDESGLARLELSEAALFERALETLAKRTDRPLTQVRPGLYVSPYTDDYDATRLLLPSLLDGLVLKGTPIAFAPDRSTLIITGSEDAANQVEAFSLVRMSQRSGARAVTLAPLALTPEGWAPWLPPPDSDARAPLLTLVADQQTEEFTLEADLMQAHWPEHQLADLRLRPTQEARCDVVAVLPAKGALLLPKADLVTDRDATQPWNEFARAQGPALEAIAETEGQWFRLVRPSA